MVPDLGACRFVVCVGCGAQVSPRSPGAELFLLDSNAYDQLEADSEALRALKSACMTGRIELLMTHVQWDELGRIPDVERRDRIANIPFVVVATYGMILGVSRVGLARVGEAGPIETARNGSLKHDHDALLASTAQHEGATLVTVDRRLTARAQVLRLESWSNARFLEHLRSFV